MSKQYDYFMCNIDAFGGSMVKNDIESIMLINFSKFKRLNEKKLEVVMDKYDLRKIDMELIFYLANCGTKDTAKDIASMGMFTKGHISQSVKRLSKQKFITSTPDEKDLRVQHLKLTDNVQTVFKEIEAIKNSLTDVMFDGISEKDLIFMGKLFEKMYDNISSYEK